MKMERLFLSYSVEKLRQLEGRIQYCLDRLSQDEVWWRGAEECNSVANLVLHLCGNVRQWILTSIDGQPDQRHRDAEFAARGNVSIPELRTLLKETVDAATHAIERLPSSRLIETIHVQGYDKSVLEAIYHVVEHFSLHTGQILYATKLLRKEDLGFYRHLSNPIHNEKTP
jgi:uncharacterized damage-inducible protein DinB